MKKFVIASFNLRNHYWDKTWDGNNYPHILANFINQEKIDFLGVQELVKLYALNLQQALPEGYQIIGQYRFGNLPFVSRINEATAIITKEEIINSETRYLARVPLLSHGTALPRILTAIETNDLFIINTHIEYWKEWPKRKQLQVLYQYILKYRDKNPIIMGDFNMDLSQTYFLDFIKNLEKINIYPIPNKDCTYNNKIIDYIFLPDCYELEEFSVIQKGDINEISDHNPILAKIRIK